MTEMLTGGPIRSIRDRVLVLRSLPRTSELSDDSLIMMAEHAQDRYFESGTIIFEEGNPVEHVHLIISGEVVVHRQGKHVTDVSRGGGFGFLSVFGRDKEGVHAKAVRPTHTLQIPARALVDAYEENFPLLRNTLKISAEFLVELRGNLPRALGSDTDVDVGVYGDHDLTLVQRVMEMRVGGVFENANLEAVIDLARAVEPVRYDAGETIHRRFLSAPRTVASAAPTKQGRAFALEQISFSGSWMPSPHCRENTRLSRRRRSSARAPNGNDS